MLKNFKSLLTNTGPKILFDVQQKYTSNYFNNLEYRSFGKYNKNKIFYIIRKYPSAGFFSNITFVLNHLKLCEDMNFIPIIDMSNYPTIYNEKKKYKTVDNSWNYYFESMNKYSLSEVYKSKNVLLSNPNFEKYMSLSMADDLIKSQMNKIKIKKKIISKADKFFKKYLYSKNHKILGVHLRGSNLKTCRGCPLPPTPEIMIKHIETLLKKNDYNKIFLVTEENKYLRKVIKHFGNKCVFYNSYRMDEIDSFKIYPRNNHRYLLGEEILIETILLSKCDGLTFVKSNVVSAAINLSKKKIKNHEIFLGFNSENKIISWFYWYIKKLFPKIWGLSILNP